MMASVGVIGAGISGAICARTLRQAGFKVTVFEKSHVMGGRMATRRRAEPYRFDHGAQYFKFADVASIADLAKRGAVEHWPSATATWKAGKMTPNNVEAEHNLVGCPAMSSVCSELLRETEVHFQHTVSGLSFADSKWTVSFLGGTKAVVDILVLTMPAPQMIRLLPSWVPYFPQVSKVTYSPNWTLMLGYNNPISIHHNVVNFEGHHVLERAIRNSSKPKRARSVEAWVVQSTNAWAKKHVEAEPAHAEKIMLQHVKEALLEQSPHHVAIHRWKYAFADPLGVDSLWHPESRVGACGDWCLGSAVEPAFKSGAALAAKIIAQNKA